MKNSDCSTKKINSSYTYLAKKSRFRMETLNGRLDTSTDITSLYNTSVPKRCDGRRPTAGKYRFLCHTRESKGG